MHTFIVRLFDAEDVDGFSGWIEEPLTGRRSAFHDLEELVASLGVAPHRADGGEPGPAPADPDAEGRAVRHQPGRS